MKNNKAKTKTLWAFWANVYGEWYSTPQEVTWDSFLKQYHHKDGNASIKKIGLDKEKDRCYFTFSSKDKKEVENFIKGYKACRESIGMLFKKND
jgi:hypothetical protein